MWDRTSCARSGIHLANTRRICRLPTSRDWSRERVRVPVWEMPSWVIFRLWMACTTLSGRLITTRFFMWMTLLILFATWVSIPSEDAGEIDANGAMVQIQSRASYVRKIWIFLPKLRLLKRQLCGRLEENSRCCRCSTRQPLRSRRYVTFSLGRDM
jgi:hypothetical protein